MFITKDAVLNTDHKDSTEQKDDERGVILDGVAFYLHCRVVAVHMPFVEKVIRRHDSHRSHGL